MFPGPSAQDPSDVPLLHISLTMRSLMLLGLLGASSLPASAHPSPVAKPGIRRRTVDLNAYRIHQSPEYHNEEATKAKRSELLVFKRETYVETATALVKSTVPNAQFRVVEDHYVSDNGIAHVNFKQTIHGLDVDNADFNVNVSLPTSPVSNSTKLTRGTFRLRKTEPSSRMVTPSTPVPFPQRTHWASVSSRIPPRPWRGLPRSSIFP